MRTLELEMLQQPQHNFPLPRELCVREEYIIPGLADEPGEGSLVVLKVGSLGYLHWVHLAVLVHLKKVADEWSESLTQVL